MFTSYQDYTSLLSASINRAGHADFEGKAEISGSFSAEHQKVKTTQINTRSVTTRVQLRHTVYTAMQEPDTPLTKGFRDALLNLAYEIESNNTVMAKYLAEMIVADYGTHYVTKIDAGGVYASIDFIRNDNSVLSEAMTNQLKMSAAVNFGKLAGFNASQGLVYNTNDTKGYSRNLTDSMFITAGGPSLGPGASANEWVAGLMRNLVPVDRTGAPLFYAVNTATLSSLAPAMVSEIRSFLQSAIERYYKANTIVGCMERDSENFNMMANVDSEDCKPPKYNHTFGGVFQTCHGDSELCKEVETKNPMSGSSTCSEGFRAIHLWSSVYKCRKQCSGWWVFKKCKTPCANYDLFWCASTGKTSGFTVNTYLFGGVYNNRISNPMTGSHSCPSAFYALKMGSSGLYVCLSRDFELGQEHAFEFGGFFSCRAGNPYVLYHKGVDEKSIASYILHKEPNNWPKRCPEGFAQHLADIDGACEIMYCLRMHAFRQAKRAYVRRPPFTQIPSGMVTNQPPKPNSISFALSSDNGDVWVRDVENNDWHYSTSQSFLSSDGKKSPSVVVASVLGSLLGTMCIAFALTVFFFRRQRQRAPRLLEGRSNINYTDDAQGEDTSSPTSDSSV